MKILSKLGGSARPLALFATGTFLLISGCGGSGGGSTSSTSAVTTSAPALEAQSMGAAADASLASVGQQATTTDAVEGAALTAGSLTDVTTSNDLLTTTGTYLATVAAESKSATTRATTSSTKTVDDVAVTISLTPTSLKSVQFTITLNGTPTGTSVIYSNFVFATGVATSGTNGTESGTHFVVTYNALRANATQVLATSDSWIYSDGSGIGSITYAATGTTVAYQSTTTNAWTWSLYQNGSATTGKLRGSVTVNANLSGSASLYCTTDTQLRSQATWTGNGTGQFCRFTTACTPNGDHPCVSY